ncbi:MAG: ABC transporter ATP-binding protein [Candidatus Aminicenantes bacterium RBG_19FT_COMBO_58_17]|nr:MAG: ABC transporter ATP-binding protein [Candidatus Aminicenantes bacterium RBG_19FT_COMBO_58_17]
MNNLVVVTENVSKAYPLPKGTLWVFEGLDFVLERGDLVAVMGASGVGKTTFLNLLGALDRPTEGKILLDGEDIQAKGEREKARLRNEKIGFVFQFYHLLPEFTALENVALPLLIRGLEGRDASVRALAILKEVFLEDKAHQKPSRLSGGEQQRVAVARALVNDPHLLLADEPTGNLDLKSGEAIMGLIQDLHVRRGLSSIVVTHNEKIAAFCRKVYVMEAGRLKRI